jgi:hypothetical protein
MAPWGLNSEWCCGYYSRASTCWHRGWNRRYRRVGVVGGGECGLCPNFVLYLGIHLTTEEISRKNLSQGRKLQSCNPSPITLLTVASQVIYLTTFVEVIPRGGEVSTEMGPKLPSRRPLMLEPVSVAQCHDVIGRLNQFKYNSFLYVTQ